MEDGTSRRIENKRPTGNFYRSILKRLYYVCKLGLVVFRDFKQRRLFATEGMRRDNNRRGLAALEPHEVILLTTTTISISPFPLTPSGIFLPANQHIKIN